LCSGGQEEKTLSTTRYLAKAFGKAVLLLCFGALAPGVSGQAKQATGWSRESLIATAREIMKAARYCALITLDSNGRPQARTMDPFPPDENMVVWMGTNPNSRKVAEILHDGHVTLYYFVSEDQAYVAISGRARIVQDAKAKAKYWKNEWKEFYRDRDKGYVLITVIPQTLEVVNVKKGIIGGNSITWTPPSVTFGSR
jgi:general stress protein 26